MDRRSAGHGPQPLTTSCAHAVALEAARAIFYRPEPIVGALIDSFAMLSDAEFPGLAAVAQMCYREPVRMSATVEVFALRPLHWPMLNLIDSAERQRRSFADAVAAAVAAARGNA